MVPMSAGMKLLLLTSALCMAAAAVAPAQHTFDPAQAGRTTVERLLKGEFAGIVAIFDETMRAALSEAQLRGA